MNSPLFATAIRLIVVGEKNSTYEIVDVDACSEYFFNLNTIPSCLIQSIIPSVTSVGTVPDYSSTSQSFSLTEFPRLSTEDMLSSASLIHTLDISLSDFLHTTVSLQSSVSLMELETTSTSVSEDMSLTLMSMSDFVTQTTSFVLPPVASESSPSVLLSLLISEDMQTSPSIPRFTFTSDVLLTEMTELMSEITFTLTTSEIIPSGTPSIHMPITQSSAIEVTLSSLEDTISFSDMVLSFTSSMPLPSEMGLTISQTVSQSVTDLPTVAVLSSSELLTMSESSVEVITSVSSTILLPILATSLDTSTIITASSESVLPSAALTFTTEFLSSSIMDFTMSSSNTIFFPVPSLLSSFSDTSILPTSTYISEIQSTIIYSSPMLQSFGTSIESTFSVSSTMLSEFSVVSTVIIHSSIESSTSFLSPALFTTETSAFTFVSHIDMSSISVLPSLTLSMDISSVSASTEFSTFSLITFMLSPTTEFLPTPVSMLNTEFATSEVTSLSVLTLSPTTEFMPTPVSMLNTEFPTSEVTLLSVLTPSPTTEFLPTPVSVLNTEFPTSEVTSLSVLTLSPTTEFLPTPVSVLNTEFPTSEVTSLSVLTLSPTTEFLPTPVSILNTEFPTSEVTSLSVLTLSPTTESSVVFPTIRSMFNTELSTFEISSLITFMPSSTTESSVAIPTPVSMLNTESSTFEKSSFITFMLSPTTESSVASTLNITGMSASTINIFSTLTPASSHQLESTISEFSFTPTPTKTLDISTDEQLNDQTSLITITAISNNLLSSVTPSTVAVTSSIQESSIVTVDVLSSSATFISPATTEVGISPTSTLVVNTDRRASSVLLSSSLSILPSSVESVVSSVEILSSELSLSFLKSTPFTSMFEILTTSSLDASSTSVDSHMSTSSALVLPSPVACPTPYITPQLEIMGPALLLRAPMYDNNSTIYNFEYGFYGVSQVSSSNNSLKKITLGPYSVEQTYSIQQYPWSLVKGSVSQNVLDLNRRETTLVVQAIDKFYSTNVDLSSLTVRLQHSVTQNTEHYACTSIDNTTGLCHSVITINKSWFMCHNTTVSIIVSDKICSNITEIVANLTLLGTDVEAVNDSLYFSMPPFNILPEESTHIALYSSYRYAVAAFSLDCNVSGNARIIGALSPNTFSLLSSFYKNETNRIAVTGFRNRNDFISKDIDSEELVTFTLSFSGSGTYSFVCTIFDLSLTSGQVYTSVFVKGNSKIISTITVSSNTPNAIYPQFPYNILLNLAVINNTTQSFGPIETVIHYNNGIVEHAAINMFSCESENESVLKVCSSCSSVYFDGNETFGDDVTIIVKHLASNVTGRLQLRVWIAEKNISISLHDAILNHICGTLYQSSEISINSYITHKANVINVDFHSLLKHNLHVKNTSIAKLNSDGNIVGVSSGTTYIIFLDNDNINATVIVSDELAVPCYLGVTVFSSISMDSQTNALSSEESKGEYFKLLQDCISEIYIHAIAVFDDGQTVAVTSDERLNLRVNNNMLPNNQPYDLVGNYSGTVFINATWSYCKDESINGGAFFNITYAIPTDILIEANVTTIAPLGDPAITLYNVSSSSQVYFKLLYPNAASCLYFNNDLVNISLNSYMLHVEPLLHYESENGYFLFHPTSCCGIVSVNFSFSEFNINRQINFTVLQSEIKVDISPSSVSLIGENSCCYQKASVLVKVCFTNSSCMQRNDARITTNNSIVVFNGTSISVKCDTNITKTIDVVVTAEINGFNGSNTLIVNNSSQFLTVTAVSFFFDNFIDVPQSVRVADCSLRLSDETFVQSTFDNNGHPYFGNLVSITSSNPEIAGITGGSNITLYGTSHMPINITCHVGNVSNSSAVLFNTLPQPLEVDIGQNYVNLSEIIIPNDTFHVPVWLNSGNYNIGVFEFILKYDSSVARYSTAEQRTDWMNGSLIITELNINELKLTGVLNTGASGYLLWLADLYFISLKEGDTEFTIVPKLLAEADIYLNKVASNQTEAHYTVAVKNEKRSLLINGDRETRKADCDLSLGDINGDCSVDARDIYYFQEYNLASIHGFLGSENAIIINNNIEENNIILDIDGDGSITLADVLTVEQLITGLVYNLSATYSSCNASNYLLLELNIIVSSLNNDDILNNNVHVFTHIVSKSNCSNFEFLEGFVEYCQSQKDFFFSLAKASFKEFLQNDSSKALYVVRINSSATLETIGISFIQVINDNISPEPRVLNLFGSESFGYNDTVVIKTAISHTQTINVTIDLLKPYFILENVPQCPDTSIQMSTAQLLSSTITSISVISSSGGMFSSILVYFYISYP